MLSARLGGLPSSAAQIPAVFRSGPAVYLLYLDESGNVHTPGDHFVVGGLAIHEADMAVLREKLQRTTAKYLHSHLTGLELHAQHMLVGKGGWRGIPKDTRHDLLVEICKLIKRFSSQATHPFALFSVIWEDGGVKAADPVERVHEELFLRFNEFLVRQSADANQVRGMVIADDSRYETTLQPITTHWREQGTRFKKLRHITEVPLFCDSKATPFIQLADIVAHAVYRNFARTDSQFFGHIVPAFDSNNNVVHGLVHLTANYPRCSCIACVSRRAAGVGSRKRAK